MKDKQITIENKHLNNAAELLQHMSKEIAKRDDARVGLGKKVIDDIIGAVELNKMLGMDANFYFFNNEDEEGNSAQAILKAVLKRATSELEMQNFRAEVVKNEN